MQNNKTNNPAENNNPSQLFKEVSDEEYVRICSNDYSFLEKAIVLGAGALGGLSALAGIRYAIGGLNFSNTPTEILYLTGALIIDYLPTFLKRPPIHFFTTYAGIHLGNLFAQVHMKKRLNQKPASLNDLEVIANTPEDLPSPGQISKKIQEIAA